ncbi:MAG: tetratricopeptide repeat protein, partial [Bacteroidetes bacterium]|nr:tetratricopeptide repeat protein [Bacteroidota bacterium]
KLDPNLSEAWNGLGREYMFQQRYRLAAKAHTRATELNPRNSEYWHSKGDAEMCAGYTKKALGSFKKVTELEPDDHHVWMQYASALSANKNLGAARAAYERAIQLQPTCSSAWYFYSGVLFLLGQTELCLDALTTSFDLDPENKELFMKQCPPEIYNHPLFRECIDSRD